MFAGTYSPNGGPCMGCADGFTTAGPGARSADDCIGTICSQYSIQINCHPKDSSCLLCRALKEKMLCAFNTNLGLFREVREIT